VAGLGSSIQRCSTDGGGLKLMGWVLILRFPG
jgi:hypothetical protein